MSFKEGDLVAVWVVPMKEQGYGLLLSCEENIKSAFSEALKTRWQILIPTSEIIYLWEDEIYELGTLISGPILRHFGNFSFPKLKRVMPNLIINDIVKVQPMTMPTSLIFYPRDDEE